MVGGFATGRNDILSDGGDMESPVGIKCPLTESGVIDFQTAATAVFHEIVAMLLGELVEARVALESVFALLGAVGIDLVKQFPGKVAALG